MATEVPPWRRRRSVKWMSPQRRSTDLLQEMKVQYAAGGRPSVSEGYLQWRFLLFVDLSGKFHDEFVFKAGLSRREFLDHNLDALVKNPEAREASLRFLAGLEYIEDKKARGKEIVLFTPSDVVEIQRLVVGGDAAVTLTHENQRALELLLQTNVLTIQERHNELSEQALPFFYLMARIILWFHTRRPFPDGNSRVAELIVCGLLAPFVPSLTAVFVTRAIYIGMINDLNGAPPKPVDASAKYFMSMQGPTPPPSGVNDITAFIIEKVWCSWQDTRNSDVFSV